MSKLVPISVIIPSHNFSNSLKRVLEAISLEEVKPNEIVVVDSSPNDSNKSLVSNFKSSLNINFLKVQKAYPGEARNIGAMNANEDILLFLDSKTVPSKNYLQKYYQLFCENQYKVIFGRTFYHADSEKQKIVKAATFGSIGHESTPGTMLLKKTFDQVGGFLQGIRRAEDLEWRERVKKNKISLNDNTISGEFMLPPYQDLPEKPIRLTRLRQIDPEEERPETRLYESIALILDQILRHQKKPA